MLPLVPETRETALAALRQFLPSVGRYAVRRNIVGGPYETVSHLSSAIRLGLLRRDEIARETLNSFAFSTAEKWLQEVYWRAYWKGWLEQRPQVWASWRSRVRHLRQSLPKPILSRAAAVARGESGVAVMDQFAGQLLQTGYLHNHARMWWASFWIHAERLPWELGAAHFFEHLIDADPASNTLSWRWVAGLQTPGKTYIVRLSNLEKYCAEDLLADRSGVERIADGMVNPCGVEEFADLTRVPLSTCDVELPSSAGRCGVWLHPDDLAPEFVEGALLPVTTVAAFHVPAIYSRMKLSELRVRHLTAAIDKAVERYRQLLCVPCECRVVPDVATGLASWARSHSLDTVVAARPYVGPIADALPQIRELLKASGVTLVLIRNASDLRDFPAARSGFFPFWERTARVVRALTAHPEFRFETSDR